MPETNTNIFPNLSELLEFAKDQGRRWAKKTDLAALQTQVGTLEDMIQAAASGGFVPAGSCAFADLPEASEETLGNVYDILDDFTTTAAFLHPDQDFPAGSNVVVIKSGDDYKYDTVAGFYDQTKWVEKQDGLGLSANSFTDDDKSKLDSIRAATPEEFAAMLAEAYPDTDAETD